MNKEEFIETMKDILKQEEPSIFLSDAVFNFVLWYLCLKIETKKQN